MEEEAGSTERMRGLEPGLNNPLSLRPGGAETTKHQTQERGVDVDSQQTINVHSCSETSERSQIDKTAPQTADVSKPELHGHSSGSKNVIPGVPHVFFEQELERMEEQKAVPAGHDIVVLAVDNSKPSDMAFQFYVDNVSRPGYFLHVVHHSNYWGNYEPMDGGPSPKHCMELMEKENAKVKEIEGKYRDLMDKNNIAGDFICLRGKDTWHDIIQHQERMNAIMIVMGTRGQNSLRRTFMGSVSDSVVHHAHCPVLVCCHPKEKQ